MSIVEKIRVYQEAGKRAAEEAVRRKEQQEEGRLQAERLANSILNPALNDQIGPLVEVAKESRVIEILGELKTELTREGHRDVEWAVGADVSFCCRRIEIPVSGLWLFKKALSPKQDEKNTRYYFSVKSGQGLKQLDLPLDFNTDHYPYSLFSMNDIENHKEEGKYQNFIEIVKNGSILADRYTIESNLTYRMSWTIGWYGHAFSIQFQNQRDGCKSITNITPSNAPKSPDLVNGQWRDRNRMENFVFEAWKHPSEFREPGPSWADDFNTT